MKNSDTIKIIILRDLMEKKGRISSYSLYRKLKIPIAEFMKSITDLQKDDFLKFDGDWLIITTAGSDFLMQTRSKSDSKRGIPKDFLRDVRLPVNALYIPSRSRLDNSLLHR